MRYFRSINQAGDTIVEVLIAIAVVSSVLAVSYATMNKNILTAQKNQERTEASKAGQAQVEALKNLTSASLAPYMSGAPFCIDFNGNPVPLIGAPSADLATENFSAYDVACKDGLFHAAIQYDPSAGNQVFRVYIRWTQIGGAFAEVVTVYRM